MWFDGPAEQRILAWRNFRKSLLVWPNDLEKVAATWAKAPTRSYLSQDDSPSGWPDPWQLITDNIYCDVSVALGMFYTLYLSNYPHKETMQLVGYKLRKSHKEVNLVFCETGKYSLNYEWGRVVNSLDFSELGCPIYKYSPKDLIV
jgi:hypothetical protein